MMNLLANGFTVESSLHFPDSPSNLLSLYEFVQYYHCRPAGPLSKILVII
jgi:hypothetical protein